MTDPIRIAFLLFPDVTQLDMTGPAQVLAKIGNAKLDYVWASRDPVATDSGFSILPTATFDDIESVDILCVPGGMGTTAVIADDAAIAWVRKVGTTAEWVTSVCTGSLILGAAGLLEGYKATTHWMWHDMLALFGAEPVAARTVVDRNRVTGCGVTAGIDFALTLMAQLRGADHARMVQLQLEYAPQPPFDTGSPGRAGAAMVAAFRKRAEAANPTRDADLRTAAAKRGYGAATAEAAS